VQLVAAMLRGGFTREEAPCEPDQQHRPRN
jgi:hypothetical protein